MTNRSSRLASGVGWNLVLRVFNLGLGLVGLRVLVDAYGQDRYGLLVLATTLLGYFSLLGMGLPGGLIRFVADCRGRDDVEGMSRYVSAALGFYLLVGGGVAVLFAAAGIWCDRFLKVRPEDVDTARRLLFILAGWSIFSWPMQVLGQVLVGLQEWRRNNLATGLQSLLQNGFYVAMGLAVLPLEFAAAAIALSQLAQFFVALAGVRAAEPRLQFRPGIPGGGEFRRLFGYSVWVMVMSLASLIIYQSQSLILATLVSTAAVGLYSVLSTPMLALREINSLVLGAVFPAVAEAHAAGDRAFVQTVIFRVSRLTLVSTIGLMSAAAAMCRPALLLWMGPEIAAHWPVATVLLIGTAYAMTWGVPGQALLAMGHARFVAAMALISAGIILATSLWLVSSLGLMGLAIACTVPTFFVSLFTIWMYFSRLEVSTWAFLRDVSLRIYLGAALGGFICHWAAGLLGPEPGKLVIVGLGLVGTPFVVGTTALVGLHRSDWSDLRRLIGRVRSRPEVNPSRG